MASREKPSKHDRSASQSAREGSPLVAMARGLAEIVAEHELTELILDTKEITLTVRRGGAAVAHAAQPRTPVPMPVRCRCRPRPRCRCRHARAAPRRARRAPPRASTTSATS